VSIGHKGREHERYTCENTIKQRYKQKLSGLSHVFETCDSWRCDSMMKSEFIIL